MKYTIHGFSQKIALSFRKEIVKGGKSTILKLDCMDLLILRWLVDFFPRMHKLLINNKEYVWVNYSTIINDLPLLDISKQSVYLRFSKLTEFGILEHQHVTDGGSFSYYRFGPNYEKLIDTGPDPSINNYQPSINNYTPSINNYQGVNKKLSRGQYKIIEGVNKKLLSKDSSIKDSSIKDSSISNPIDTANNISSGTPEICETQTDYDKKEKNKIKNTERKRVWEYFVQNIPNEEIRAKVFAIMKNRIEKDRPITIEFAKLFLKKLEEYSLGIDAQKINILNKSIDYGYINIFDPRESSYDTSSRTSSPHNHKGTYIPVISNGVQINPSYDLEEEENFESSPNYIDYLKKEMEGLTNPNKKIY